MKAFRLIPLLIVLIFNFFVTAAQDSLVSKIAAESLTTFSKFEQTFKGYAGIYW